MKAGRPKGEVLAKIEEAAAALARAVEDVDALAGQVRKRGGKAGAMPTGRALFAAGIKQARKAEMALRAARKAVDGAAGG